MEELSTEENIVNIDNNHNTPDSSSETSDFRPAQDYVPNLKKDKGDVPSKKWVIKRITAFSDSDNDSEENANLSALERSSQIGTSVLQSDDSKSDTNNARSKIPRKPRIQRNLFSDSEDSDAKDTDKNKRKDNSKSVGAFPRNSDNEENKSGNESDNAVKNREQQLRMKNKRNNLTNKFQSLLKARGKGPSQENIENGVIKSASESSSESSAEMASIEKIKQKIKERMSFKPSICDPDTSDDEVNQQKSIYKQKNKRKTKITSPKPPRMSAKQAMENMQKIKSESNRMLREKEVSLPYHRPKALSLKDIMNRRKLAVSSDGKALPIKMNEEQLKQYAQMLEERQKEMMELCKSESDEEETEENSAKVKDAIENEINNTNKKLDTEISYDDKTITNIYNHTNDVTEPNNSNVNADNDSTGKNNEETLNEQDSESNLQLVYNDSANSLVDDNLTADTKTVLELSSSSEIEKDTISQKSVTITSDDKHENETKHHQDSTKNCTENDSQLIVLHYENSEYSNIKEDSTVRESIDKPIIDDSDENSLEQEEVEEDANNPNIESPVETNVIDKLDSSENVKNGEMEGMEIDNEFSDDDVNIQDIDNIIENAEIIKNIEDKMNSQFLVRDKPLNLNPKLTGAPGMVIDLDDSDTAPRKSGVELLKERFTYFNKLKTPEEMEREREKKLKPGTQLKELKQELEEKIAEQRSLEWAKRLEDEKQQQRELKELRGEESDEDDIDKIEAAIEEKEETKEDSDESESEEEEPVENDIEISDKPRIKNAMLDEEAEESECDEDTKDNDINEDGVDENCEHLDGNENDDGVEADNDERDSESSESDDSSESEEEEQIVTKKGRILKAFEDSDDDNEVKDLPVTKIKDAKGTTDLRSNSSVHSNIIASQDDDLQLAQRAISTSEDLFTSQESALVSGAKEQSNELAENDETFTQTFSILESSNQQTVELDLISSGKSAVCTTQSLDISNIEDTALCPVTDSQNLPLPSQIPTTQQSQSQPIGEDILALCTGQFYNNMFVSQAEDQPAPLINAINYDAFDNYQSQDSQEIASQHTNKDTEVHKINHEKDKLKESDDFIVLQSVDSKVNKKEYAEDDNLRSILDELSDPEFDAPKPNKYFLESDAVKNVGGTNQIKRKLVIDSDDEDNNETDGIEAKKRKKLKKKKPEKRALQISDDEEEQPELDEMDAYESDIGEAEPDVFVEYDSEENEIEVQKQPQHPKKKRKMAEFFENEAELTSEDEWAGSGDEDEAGLDRMEREEGDDDKFHQGKLQRELGQIHMRDVLDQDKREVRLIQELLFEDGDLGAGSRQRKFRWNDMGAEETGTVPDEFADTQEEEFESEEQWRKQRHEREMFLRQLHNKGDAEESLNVSMNRTTIIKANLLSKTMSTVLREVDNCTEKTETTVIVEKKTVKDIPSPKKPFAMFQQSYQGSLLCRGRGALARLAALATPLAADDDAVGTIGPTSRRNFVFAALTPEEKQPKLTKRKAESNPNTPKLVKKMRSEEQSTNRSSLLDHFKL